MTATAAAAVATLVVAEVFGPTVQGEGPSTGRRASFLRLGACNLSCDWCDTPYTWDASRFDLRAELTRRPVPELVDRLLEGHPGIVVITGGEPLLHQRRPGWIALLDALHAAGVEIEIETNGTIPPTDYTAERVTRFNVSPKLQHAGDPEDKRIRPDALAALVTTGKAAFKFVARTGADVDQVAALAAAHHLPAHTVWLMPEGTTTAELDTHLHTIADPAIAAGFNLTTRLHVYAWGNERAR
ncbi:7-carboxy-7-deazaguanine synthase QueE [Streptomyces sp. ISL-96]|uniref:7-carboxy-7-deazaguanine synthase QueE n=1 Tax=Streptomyces sp. ISL-96 TaxID=2819191 RepID=UPI001BE84A1E|nr:7-carboxy-7-deazaguanine synthase QueE [Streptomyces sp. ISL-96]MBT2490628.1 7-carboxy-7-deazaguanine synthase QueE [Streptomyces sp. ISL-96]